MQCKSCQTNIDPKWKHAIAQNVCPFCGQEVMEELLKNLLSTLQETMNKLQEYPDQLNDWLMSNYNYIKTDSPNLINFVPKELLTPPPAPTHASKKENADQKEELTKKIIKIKHKDGTEEEVVSEVKKTQSETNAFFDRANGKLNKKSSASSPSSEKEFASIAEKTAYLGQLAKKIKEKAETPITNQESLANLIERENDLNVDENDINDPDDISNIDDRDDLPFKRSNASAPSRDILEDDPDMTDQILSMNMSAKGMGGGKDGNYNHKDAALLRQADLKRQQSRENFESGANRGKGGFSRSS